MAVVPILHRTFYLSSRSTVSSSVKLSVCHDAFDPLWSFLTDYIVSLTDDFTLKKLQDVILDWCF